MSQLEKLYVMHVILNLDRAGAQEVVRILAEHLKIDCKIIVCTLRDGPLRNEMEAAGIIVEILPYSDKKIPFVPKFITRMFSVRRGLVDLIRRYEVDIIQTHLLEIYDFLIPTLRYKTPLQGVFWTIHNVNFLPTTIRPDFSILKKQVYRFLYKLTVKKADGFIAVSEQVAQAIIKQIDPAQDKVFTICNGVNTARFEEDGNKASLCNQLGINLDSKLISTVGRLTIQKGHVYLLKAAQEVIAVCPNAHFLFIGEGELYTLLYTQSQELGLQNNIHFLGNRRDVPVLLASADIFVLPSLWEGLSIALLEAMASAMPVVATTVSGTVQVIRPGENGLLVPPKDSVALAEAITQLLSNPEQARLMGQKARNHVEHYFSAQKQADEHLALYQQILHQSDSSRHHLT